MKKILALSLLFILASSLYAQKSNYIKWGDVELYKKYQNSIYISYDTAANYLNRYIQSIPSWALVSKADTVDDFIVGSGTYLAYKHRYNFEIAKCYYDLADLYDSKELYNKAIAYYDSSLIWLRKKEFFSGGYSEALVNNNKGVCMIFADKKDKIIDGSKKKKKDMEEDEEEPEKYITKSYRHCCDRQDGKFAAINLGVMRIQDTTKINVIDETIRGFMVHINNATSSELVTFDIAYICNDIAIAYILRKDTLKADSTFNEAISRINCDKNQLHCARLNYNKALAYLANGRYGLAERYFFLSYNMMLTFIDEMESKYNPDDVSKYCRELNGFMLGIDCSIKKKFDKNLKYKYFYLLYSGGEFQKGFTEK